MLTPNPRRDVDVKLKSPRLLGGANGDVIFPADTGCLSLPACGEQQFDVSPVLLTVAGDAR